MIGIEQIATTLKNVFNNKLRPPANVIPGIIMATSLVKRPGLSSIVSTSNIIQNLEKQGIPTEPLPDGSPNLTNIMVKVIVDEVIRAIKEDSNVQISIPPGSLNVLVTGTSSGGQVNASGPNINFSKGVGLIQ